MRPSFGLVLLLAGCAGSAGASAPGDGGDAGANASGDGGDAGASAPGDAGDAGGSAVSLADGGDGAAGASDAHGDAPGAGPSEAGSAAEASAPADAGCGAPATYDQIVLCDHPVAYWAMNQATANAAAEPDLTGNGNPGHYVGGPLPMATLPNGDSAADFDGSTCKPKAGGSSGAVMCTYLAVASKASLSIPTTGELTWEGWIRPDVLQFPHDDVAGSGGAGGSGYVDWMGKCDSYAPTCEWEARMYDTTTKETPNRPNRISAYVFNPSAGLGSAADWQPAGGVIQTAQWHHVVGEYTTKSQPADCPNVPASPGSIGIWVDGVPWSQSNHNPTGCMSQYNVVPTANGSAVNIGTMAFDSWFQGAIGKVAIYDTLLSQTQITSHYSKMTAKAPAGACADTCTL